MQDNTFAAAREKLASGDLTGALAEYERLSRQGDDTIELKLTQAFINFYQACQKGEKKEIKALGQELLGIISDNAEAVDVDFAAALAPLVLSAAQLKIKFAMSSDYFIHRDIVKALLNIILGFMSSDEGTALSQESSLRLYQLAADLDTFVVKQTQVMDKYGAYNQLSKNAQMTEIYKKLNREDPRVSHNSYIKMFWVLPVMLVVLVMLIDFFRK